MSLPPSSGSLVSGFPQQGTVDWAQLVGHTASFTLSVLSRFSAANVDLYTLEVGRIVSQRFEISSLGRENVTNGLNGLVSYGILGDILWFGFGSRHVVRAMPSTSEGLMCLALCGVLSEYYNENISPEVLHELVRILKAPPQLTPSILQWKALIRSCAGVFAKTAFGTLVEEMIQYNPYAWYRTTESRGTVATREGFATPKSISEALHGIGSISRGEQKSITISGGNDVGWLAAVAIWLFDLRIRICNAEDVQLFSNCGEQEPQVNIIFERRGSPIGNTSSGEHQTSQGLQCLDRTYVFGRIPWNSLFKGVFGKDFETIITGHPQTLATAIGSAARLLRGIVNAEDEVPKKLISCWQTYVHGSYGQGFLRNILEWFPELESLKHGMEAAASKPFLDAKVRYEQQIEVLRLISEMVVEEGLFPKRAGAEAIYRRQIAKRERFTRQGNDFQRSALVDELGPFAYIYRDPPNPSEGLQLENCIELFMGFKYNQGEYTALAEEGICIYRSILNGMSDDIEISGKIHILPGTIEYHGRPYTQVADYTGSIGRVTYDMLEVVSQYTQVAMDIKETTQQLEVWFNVTGTGNSVLQPLQVTPSALVANLCKAHGWVKCRKSGCKHIYGVPMGNSPQFDVLGRSVQIIKGGKIARCAATTLADRLNYCCIMQDKCIQCCIRTGVSGMQGYELTMDENDELTKNAPVLIVSRIN
ncbi:hypothetical protein V502_00790 [Pseudogymnoascus sp. VKM F-4520 (FW-2644)]|nr:hypothetical protein V502_00790 [Pseudogymnoascus sp. VKM F-4520 (FW-2644)]